MTTISTHSVISGTASAPALVLDEPLSLWGGLDAASGRITDVHHPQHGVSISGQVVIMASGRGSSSASSVLAEAARLGTAPAAFVLHSPDEILVLGALVAEELYDITIPISVTDAAALSVIKSGDTVTIDDGQLTVS